MKGEEKGKRIGWKVWSDEDEGGDIGVVEDLKRRKERNVGEDKGIVEDDGIEIVVEIIIKGDSERKNIDGREDERIENIGKVIDIWEIEKIRVI